MEHLVRILNDNDRQTLAWLRRHVGDARLSDAARRLIAQREQHAGIGSKPYLSAVCRYLGVRPPAPRRAPKIVAGNPIADLPDTRGACAASGLNAQGGPITSVLISHVQFP
ncbi:hypothetical protein WCQ02_39420 [Paraburkholderia tropica]|uniref:Uncharacterized protein n=1 Tax=Paraburkholderia tropica TaxID=92647 RepID=A0ABX5MCP9_9BURK|nr:hypothetical protein [Paraburkholderia tropica]PXX04214.1 hypothetical protein C7400_1478 [Paraburkholderia tropica]PZW69500.1 hypothetical protein C7399_1478 [Paraburkholderia tropica]